MTLSNIETPSAAHPDPVSHDELLAASERAGGLPNGRIIPLGCLENRVYWIQSDKRDDHIIKVYRKRRWTENQLDVEHDFLCELEEHGCEVAAPLDVGEGFTIGSLERNEAPTFYAVFHRLAGRMRDELTLKQCEHLGDLIRRVHQVGEGVELSAHRQPKDQVAALSTWLDTKSSLPDSYRSRAHRWLGRILESDLHTHDSLIHGDLHLGNVIWDGDTPYLIDFDDCGLGWFGQDLWLIAPGSDEWHREKRRILLEAYGQGVRYHELESQLTLLRALRMLNYTRWIASRWPDPAFVNAYPEFGTAVFFGVECRALDELEGEWLGT